MSSFPPPPPPPGGPNQPGQPNYPQSPPNSTAYNRTVWKAQRRAAKQQERWARQQMKLQRRMMRPRSVVGPLVVIALGIVFLLVQMGKLSGPQAVDWYAHWWPLILIAAGLVLLAEWALDQQTSSAGQPYRGRTVGGGVVFLLLVLAFFGVTSHEAYRHFHWGDDHQWGFVFPNIDEALGEEYDADDSISTSIQPGSSLLIRNPHGDVTVTGSSDDGQVHVSIHKVVHARSDEGATTREAELQPKFSGSGNLTLDVPSVDGGQGDLTVEVPHGTLLTISANHGNISVDEIHADVSLSANKGSVSVSAISGAVTAHINDEHSDFSAHSVTGTLNIDGRLGDANISDIAGPVTLQGDFFGDTHIERVNGALQFKSSRTEFEAARLDGALDLDGETLDGDQFLGPVQVTTKYGKDITLNRVQGNVRIVNSVKGDISVTSASPLGQIDISNTTGSVDVGVPNNAGFVVNIDTHNGDIENDFGLKRQGSDDHPLLVGKVGAGGPSINITMENGDVTLRKATVVALRALAPLPKLGPAPKPPKPPKPPIAPEPPAILKNN